jgi:tRNA pseudouridine38-40 synthase
MQPHVLGKLSISQARWRKRLQRRSSTLLGKRSVVSKPNQNPPQIASEAQTWKLTLAYDGTDFHGWQVQPDRPTIQGELQAALGRIADEAPLPQGSGRTDAGVHALAQVASFRLTAPIPPENLRRALNRTLPSSIRVTDARTVPSSFHARHSARAKTYEYRIFRGENPSPFLTRYVYDCLWKIDPVILRESARIFLGEHDFLSFAATDPDQAARGDTNGADEENLDCVRIPSSTVRTIFSSCWEERPFSEERSAEAGSLLVYRVRGNGFLHHMVRNLVGTMLEVGRGRMALDELPRILAARSRPLAGPTAPARGLFLHSVEYAEE